MQTRTSYALSPLDIAHGSVAVTARGQRTLDRLIVAAGKVFTKRGFLEARMSDIAKQAGVAHGTVYTYFNSKEEVFLAVATRAVDDILKRSTVVTSTAAAEPRANIREAAASVVSAYQEHAAILGSLTVVASFDKRASDLRQFLTLQLIERADRVTSFYQRASLADPTLNRPALATALGAMAESFAYTALVEENGLSREDVIDTLSHVWVTSIGLRNAPARKRNRQT